MLYQPTLQFHSIREEFVHVFSRCHPDPPGLLGAQGVPDRPALRPGGRRRDLPSRDAAAGPRPRALEDRLRPALAPAHRRPLRRKPEPPAALLPVPGLDQTLPLGRAAAIPPESDRARDRPPARTTSASWRTTGNRRPWAPRVSGGKSGWTGWRSPSSPISRWPAASSSCPVSVEITYGLERIAMYLQQIDNVYDLQWNRGPALR